MFRAEVGQMVGEGMALGVTDSTTVVQRAMVALTAVPPALSPGSRAAAPEGRIQPDAQAPIQVTNNFQHMDPQVAVDATTQSLAAMARRVRPA